MGRKSAIIFEMTKLYLRPLAGVTRSVEGGLTALGYPPLLTKDSIMRAEMIDLDLYRERSEELDMLYNADIFLMPV